MATKNLHAIILSRKNYGEADKLVCAFSKEEGKIKIKARGCRKIKSRLASQVEPFSVGKYYLAEGKDCYVLAGSDGVIQNSHIIKNIEIYKDASYICELLQLAFEDREPNRPIYELTKDALSLIEKQTPNKRKVLIRYFEFILLSELGYSANYLNCRKCGKKLEKKDFYIGDHEGVFCGKCRGSGERISLDILKILRLFNNSSLKEILNIKGIEKYNNEIKNVTFPYLCGILPKNPKSSDL